MRKSYERTYVFLVAILLIPLSLFASRDFEPVFKPDVNIVKLTESIKIDGKLDDHQWTLAPQITQFHERHPRELAEPEVTTRAMLAYDEDNLYIAFICDDDPAEIRATMCQRDHFFGDDNVCVLIDTYSDASRAYEFFVNPYGIQMDRLWSSVAGEDPGFDLIWESAAEITDSGYQVEIAIPFASLRFPNRDIQNWKVDLWRSRPRESYNQYSWAAYDRNEECWVCQWGTVNGIENVQPGKGIEILPTFVATQSGSLSDYDSPDAKIKNGDITGDLSLGGKYSPTSDITIEAAYNPDFSQIEADAAQIDVNTTFALFYPERRPFFQEGSDLFRTLYNSFYTRTINDPKFAAKMIGRLGRTNISGLSAVDENSPYIIPMRESSILMNTGRSYVNVFRGLQTIGDNSRIGFLASDRRFEHDGSGTVMALDFDIRLSQNYRIDGQYIGTHTREPDDSSFDSMLGDLKFDSGKYTAAFDGESYYGTAFITRLLRRSRSLNVMLDYNQISPTYRTQLGYDPINSHRTFSAGAEYVFYPKGSIFERITPSAFQFLRWEFEGGEQRNKSTNMSLNMQTRFAQTYFSIYYNNDWERYSGIEFDRLWSIGLEMGSRLSDRLGYNLSLRRGVGVSYYDLARGRETGAFFALNLKPYDRLIIEPYINYSRSVHEENDEVLFDGYIFRTRLRYQANREMSLRLVVQYNNFRERWDVDPLLTYRLGSFTVFYVGSTYNYDNIEYDPGKVSQWKLSSRQFFMKLQYLFRS